MNDDKIMTSLRDESLYYRAPAYLRVRVEAALPQPARRSSRPLWQPWRLLSIHPALAWATGGMTGIVASALVFALLAPGHPSQESTLERELVSSHVRALLSQHSIDVVSTDQHTVKPWFNGRLDYVPPVIELSGQGYPLVGGRVDYVGHRTVAVLAYRYRQHPIELYVFPEASGNSPPAASMADGYSIAHWRQGGMDFWAISDAEPSHLESFAKAVQDKVGHADAD